MNTCRFPSPFPTPPVKPCFTGQADTRHLTPDTPLAVPDHLPSSLAASSGEAPPVLISHASR